MKKYFICCGTGYYSEESEDFVKIEKSTGYSTYDLAEIALIKINPEVKKYYMGYFKIDEVFIY
jgi:hypothetical protein